MPASRPASPYTEIAWDAWGDPAEAKPLSDDVRALLAGALGVGKAAAPAIGIDGVELAASRLGDPAREALAAAIGAEHVVDDAEARIRHTRGKSTPDLLRLRAGEASAAPDAIALPATHDEVLAILEICSGDRIAVVPFGGGTSVVGSLEPDASGFAALLAIDTRRLNRLVEVDAVSRTATFEPGLRGPQAEQLLGEQGLTIGHHPQSYEFATIGGFAAARSSGQASAGYGRFDELVLGLRVATPRGTIELGRAPRSAAGPDLRQLILGSEGSLGVITSVTVAVRPAPTERVYEGWRFASFAEGAVALRALAQDGPRPTVLRLSDEAETAINLARPSEIGSGEFGGCLAIAGWEGADVAAARDGGAAVLGSHGGTLDADAGRAWEEGRYRAPYMRDALLDAGALVDTLETTTFWSGIEGLYSAVGDAIRAKMDQLGAPGAVLCHISHVYPSGASLYFTVACAQRVDPVEQWLTIKAAASDAIIASGGSISHHHGVGVDHRDWYEREIGPLAIDVLRAAKRSLDPEGILNPGVLIPPG